MRLDLDIKELPKVFERCCGKSSQAFCQRGFAGSWRPNQQDDPMKRQLRPVYVWPQSEVENRLGEKPILRLLLNNNSIPQGEKVWIRQTAAIKNTWPFDPSRACPDGSHP